MYARLEEDHGLARHAMAIYDRATKAVLPEEQFEVRPVKYINWNLLSAHILKI
jgi:hypothetical protein